MANKLEDQYTSKRLDSISIEIDYLRITETNLKVKTYLDLVYENLNLAFDELNKGAENGK